MWKLHMQSIIMEKTNFKTLKDCYSIFEVLNTLPSPFQEERICKHTCTQKQKCIYGEAQIPIHTDIEREAKGCMYIHISRNPDSVIFIKTHPRKTSLSSVTITGEKSMVASNTYCNSSLWYGCFWFPDSP